MFLFTEPSSLFLALHDLESWPARASSQLAVPGPRSKGHSVHLSRCPLAPSLCPEKGLALNALACALWWEGGQLPSWQARALSPLLNFTLGIESAVALAQVADSLFIVNA